MKKIIALGITVLIILVTLVGCDENENKNNDNNAYLPHIMFDEVLYRLSPNKIDSYILNGEELHPVGSVESVINGTSFPQENLQVNGLTDLLDCNIYTTDLYPKHLFILKNDGGYVAFVEENNSATISENSNGTQTIVNAPQAIINPSQNGELTLRTYVASYVVEGDGEVSSTLLLQNDNGFALSANEYISYMPSGKYAIDNEKLLLTVADDEVYVFIIDDDKLIFESGTWLENWVEQGTVFHLKAEISNDNLIFINDPPSITVMAGDVEIKWVVGKNTWNNADYDRLDNFQWIMSETTFDELPYVKNGEVISIQFDNNIDSVPHTYTLTEHILREDGNLKYNIEGKEYEFNIYLTVGDFIIEPNYAVLFSSYSWDYEPGNTIKGYRLICRWGDNSCEYAFIIRGDAAIQWTHEPN